MSAVGSFGCNSELLTNLLLDAFSGYHLATLLAAQLVVEPDRQFNAKFTELQFNQSVGSSLLKILHF